MENLCEREASLSIAFTMTKEPHGCRGEIGRIGSDQADWGDDQVAEGAFVEDAFVETATQPLSVSRRGVHIFTGILPTGSCRFSWL